MNLKIGHHVVLVHGIFDDGRIFDRMRSALEDRGLVTHAIDLNPASGRTGLHPLARQLAGFIDAIAVAKVDLVGFSMGGIVARVFMQSLGGHARVRRLITIASPHHGTHMGHLMPFGGGARDAPREPVPGRPEHTRRRACRAYPVVALDAVRPHDPAALERDPRRRRDGACAGALASADGLRRPRHPARGGTPRLIAGRGTGLTARRQLIPYNVAEHIREVGRHRARRDDTVGEHHMGFLL